LSRNKDGFFKKGFHQISKRIGLQVQFLFHLPLKEVVTRGSPYTELVPEIRATKSMTESFDSDMGAASVAKKSKFCCQRKVESRQ